jgi:hypothetical protein
MEFNLKTMKKSTIWAIIGVGGSVLLIAIILFVMSKYDRPPTFLNPRTLSAA